MASRPTLLAVVLAGAVLLVAMLVVRAGISAPPDPAGASERPRASAEPAPGLAADSRRATAGGGADGPPELGADYPPGTRIPLRVERTERGVQCPDGTFLPLLNGVPEAPALTRSAHLGPVPPVVALIVDDLGYLWYEHADGSATTTRYRDALVDGVPVRNIETVHNAALPTSAAQVRPDR